ncbi:MAG: diguanylate cyclase [Bdellovibrionota bacterium]
MIQDIHPADYLVFIVESDKNQSSILNDLFQKWGFQVKVFSSSDLVIETMKKGELPHILFADLQMQGLSGLGIAKRAKELSSEIEIVFTTSNPTVEMILEAVGMGVYDYLMKPFDKIDDIRNMIFHVCERIYLRLYNEYLVSELKLKNEEIRGLSQMSTELAELVDAAKIIDVGCKYLSKAFGGAQICFLQYIPQDTTLMMSSRLPMELFGGVQTKYPIPRDDGSSIALVADYLKGIEKDLKLFELLDSSEVLSPMPLRKVGVWKAFPFVTRSIPRGVFVIKVVDWDDEIQRPLAIRYLQAIEKYFENALLHKKVFEMSVKDGLTGLYNVRAFRERMDAELKAAERIHHPVSLIFFDVDHFKKYNDTHGHPAGDVILKTMAKLLHQNFRVTDFIVRYGGEEFCVLLPHTELASALKKAEAFRKVVETYPFPKGETQPLGKLSVSIGVSEYPTHAANAETLVRLADEALYRAKKESRNAVHCAQKGESHVAPFESEHVTKGR